MPRVAAEKKITHGSAVHNVRNVNAFNSRLRAANTAQTLALAYMHIISRHVFQQNSYIRLTVWRYHIFNRRLSHCPDTQHNVEWFPWSAYYWRLRIFAQKECTYFAFGAVDQKTPTCAQLSKALSLKGNEAQVGIMTFFFLPPRHNAVNAPSICLHV